MRLKTLASVFVLSLFPAVALAEGCNWQHLNESASQCPEGQSFDTTSGSCVQQTTS